MKQEIRITDTQIATMRTFAHSLDRLWEAWTDPALIGLWWGPDGFRTTTSVFEFKPGGRWIFTMHGPNGVDYPNEVVFDEIVERSCIRYTHVKPPFRVEVLFDPITPTITKVVFLMSFASKEDRDAKRVYADIANEQFMTRLDRVLSGATPSE